MCVVGLCATVGKIDYAITSYLWRGTHQQTQSGHEELCGVERLLELRFCFLAARVNLIRMFFTVFCADS